MKSEWKRLSLGEITENVIDCRGKTPKKLGGDWSESGYRALSAKNIKTGRIVQLDTIRYINDEMYKRWMKEEVQRGDILITSEAPFGQIFFWDSEEKIVLSQRLFCVRIKPEYDARFIYYYMTTPVFQSELEGRATGTTVIGLRQPELMKCVIRCPRIQEQKAIATVLSAIDAKIIVNEKLNDNLQQQAAALFATFYDRAETEVGFTEIIQILGGGTPKTGESSYWNGDVPFFTPKDVGSPYTLATEKTITEEGLAHCNSRLYPINTVFVTARGTVGKVGLPGVPMAMNQSCYALVGKDTHQLLVYFYTLKAVDRLKHKASGAVFDAITTRDFESEIIMKLSDDDEKAFLDVAQPIYQAVLSNSIENLGLAALRDSLLPKLMSGEIDVSAVQL
mgnify:CR=1 FL=1